MTPVYPVLEGQSVDLSFELAQPHGANVNVLLFDRLTGKARFGASNWNLKPTIDYKLASLDLSKPEAAIVSLDTESKAFELEAYAANDTQAEGDEVVSLEAYVLSGHGEINEPAQRNLVIQEFAGAVRFSESWLTAKESEGTIQVEIERIAGKGGEFSVGVISQEIESAGAGGAVEGVDFQAMNETVTFSADDDMRKTVTLKLLDDTEDECQEELLELVLVQHDTERDRTEFYSLNESIQVWIQDDEEAQTPTVSFSQLEYSVVEGNTVEVTAHRTGDVCQQLSLDISIDEVFASSTDYFYYTNRLLFRAGEETATFAIHARTDSLAEQGESVRATLTGENAVFENGSVLIKLLDTAEEDLPDDTPVDDKPADDMPSTETPIKDSPNDSGGGVIITPDPGEPSTEEPLSGEDLESGQSPTNEEEEEDGDTANDTEAGEPERQLSSMDTETSGGDSGGGGSLGFAMLLSLIGFTVMRYARVVKLKK